MSLTPKQERFCQCIVSGMSGKDSYLTAYNGNSERAAMIESTKLLAREDINERLKELRKPIEALAQSQAITEREEVKALLLSFIRDESLSPETRMKASDQLNKMNAEYINVNRNIDTTDSSIDALDVETLKKLAGDV